MSYFTSRTTVLHGALASEESWRGLSLVTPPAREPITLAEAKAHLRVEHTADDAVVIPAQLRAARSFVENYLNRAIMKQRWRLSLDTFPGADEPVRLYRPPLMSVVTVRYLDGDGVWQTLHDAAGAPPITGVATCAVDDAAWIVPAKPGDTWPDTLARAGAIEVVFDAGYREPTTTGDPLAPVDGDPGDKVPFEIKAAILLTLGTLYANREDTVVGTIVAELPLSAQALLAPLRASGVA